MEPLITEVLAPVKSVPALRFPEFEGEWVLQHLEAIVDKKISYGIVQAGEHVPNGMPYIKSQDLNTALSLEMLQRTSDIIANKYKRSEVGPGDIVFSLRGNIGVSQIVPNTIKVANLTQGTARISVSKYFLNLFVRLALQTTNTVQRILAVSKGSTFQEISLSDLRKIEIYAPSLDEQQKVAGFLKSIEDKIQQFTKKKILLESYKKGVVKQIFSREIRFKDEHGQNFPEWEEKQLGYYLKSFKETSNNNNQYEVLTSSTKGLMKQSDYYGENRLTERDNSGFNIIPAGFLTYRSRSDTRKFYFNENQLGLTGVISTYYPVFTMKNKANKFFIELTNFYQSRIGSHSVGTSQTVLSYNDLQRIKFHFPCDAEQIKIGDFLTSIDCKITIVTKQLEQVQQFKKGLLQQLFV